MNKKLLLASIVASVTVAACAKREADNTKVESTTATTSSISESDSGASFAVLMKRDPCYGTCPAYTVEIRGSGSVRFKGERFTIDTLEHMSNVLVEKVKALREQFIKGNFASLAPLYGDTASVCEAFHTDAPRYTITLSEIGSSKTVVHDLGCRGAPAILATLEAAVDSTANIAQWLKPATTGKQ